VSARLVRQLLLLGTSVAYSEFEGGERMSHRILVLAAEEDGLAGLRRFFESQGHDVDFTTEPPLAEALLSCVHYSLFIADPELGKEQGADVSDIVSFARRQSAVTRVVTLARSGSSCSRRLAEAALYEEESNSEPVSSFAWQELEERLSEAS